MKDEGKCDCPKWGVSCMVMTNTPEGVWIKMDWDCLSLEILRQKETRYSQLKHTLAEGGVRNDYEKFVL